MPELPEVETVMRGLEKVLLHRRFMCIEARRKDLRFPIPKNLAALCAGSPIQKLERRAKYILLHFKNGRTLLLHLGMSGRLVIDAPNEKSALQKHDHIIFTTDKNVRIRFNDARRFGMVDVAPSSEIHAHKLLRHLGYEPLEKEFTAAALHEKLHGKKIAIKLAIMDQKVVVGVGNIYASEALFGAGINPRRAASSLIFEETKLLVVAIKKTLARAIAKGGSTLRDYVQADGELGYFQHEFKVYGRAGEKCKNRNCASLIKQITQGGRSTFFCPRCQG